jgi:hypothetical protein
MELRTILICIFVSIVAIIVAKEFGCQDDELFTLKSVCDERDRSCFIACTDKNNMLIRECYKRCQINSPIC